MTTQPDCFGKAPTNIKWTIVRGDTASLQVDFYNQDGITEYNTSGWTYLATAFDKRLKQYYTLGVESTEFGVRIVADPEVTGQWGTGIQNTVAELKFDLQVTTDEDVIWTPVIGTITVRGDVTNV